ncbi:DUF6788 family protein [Candidatus Eisenbacteria bacterium]|uniref:DUF6788 family protein n=1 Tax=Eiseniibacteriota bacterium TaxID=2212470 RepID=A0ABV6YI50_UNCEI
MAKEERRVEQLKRKLAQLGPMLPGSISEQWNVCGTPGCQCKDPDKPKKHGPYYQLSFTVGGRSSTMFSSWRVKRQHDMRARIFARFHYSGRCQEVVEVRLAQVTKPSPGIGIPNLMAPQQLQSLVDQTDVT